MKQILLLILFLAQGLLGFAQTEEPAEADSLGGISKIAIPLEVKISCENQKFLLGWDLSSLDSSQIPVYLNLRAYKAPLNDTIRSYFLTRTLDSLEVQELELWVSEPGLYYLEGMDSARNIFFSSAEVQIEICALFQLPSSFTPGEGKLFKPLQNQSIERIELVIFDGQGQEVFYTEEPDFAWDGRNPVSGELCKRGTYFYNCDVFERRGQRVVKRNTTGMIEIVY